MTFELRPRFRYDERPPSHAPGIYAYFISSSHELRPVSVPRDAPLYIGMTDSSLDARCHFEHAHSGFSTLRRSLGAILKDQLRLRAFPRAPGASRSNVLSYRFGIDDEPRLTEWMRKHLTYSYREIPDNIAAAEKDAISLSCPPLNLMGWRNPQRAEIMRLRAICVAEANLSRAR